MSSSPSPSAGATSTPRVVLLPRGRRFEDVVNQRVAHALWKRGWRTQLEPYAGYGGQGWVRVLARAVLKAPAPAGASAGGAVRVPGGPSGSVPLDPAPRVRGWRNLVTIQVEGVVVDVRTGSATRRIASDRGGYLDALLPADLPPGWHEVELAHAGGTVRAPVFVVAPGTTAGIVSDIDDTVMITSAPRPLLAVWNTFVVHEGRRRPVPGMAALYADLLRGCPGAPVMYLSAGAWNSAPALGRFLRRFGYPPGPLLLTDWGPTRAGWFRDGTEHKRAALRRLIVEFPHIRWILIGDDGQRDPQVYAELATARPDRVRAVVIRQLSGTEQVIVHGSPARPAAVHEALVRTAAAAIPVVAARNGTRLAQGLAQAGIDLT